jgi:BON domain
LIFAGCNNGPKYPDSESAVNNALTQNNLGSIHVSQDRDKGVVTLTGTVPNQDQKAQAENVAKGAASAYTIATKLQLSHRRTPARPSPHNRIPTLRLKTTTRLS